jgi:hypothetical protein
LYPLLLAQRLARTAQKTPLSSQSIDTLADRLATAVVLFVARSSLSNRSIGHDMIKYINNQSITFSDIISGSSLRVKQFYHLSQR